MILLKTQINDNPLSPRNSHFPITSRPVVTSQLNVSQRTDSELMNISYESVYFRIQSVGPTTLCDIDTSVKFVGVWI